MAIYDMTVKKLGADFKDGLESIAKSIDRAASKPIINVIVMPGATADDIEAKVTETLDRIRAREARIGRD